MASGATGIRLWRRARSPRCARSSVPEESARETFPADFLRRQCRESGSHPGCCAGSAPSSPATHTTLFGKSSWYPAPDYPYVSDRHCRNASAVPKQLNFPKCTSPLISVSYRWKMSLEERQLCRDFHFWARRRPVTDTAFRIGTGLAETQNLDRDVIRSAA